MRKDGHGTAVCAHRAGIYDQSSCLAYRTRLHESRLAIKVKLSLRERSQVITLDVNRDVERDDLRSPLRVDVMDAAGQPSSYFRYNAHGDAVHYVANDGGFGSAWRIFTARGGWNDASDNVGCYDDAFTNTRDALPTPRNALTRPHHALDNLPCSFIKTHRSFINLYLPFPNSDKTKPNRKVEVF